METIKKKKKEVKGEPETYTRTQTSRQSKEFGVLFVPIAGDATSLCLHETFTIDSL